MAKKPKCRQCKKEFDRVYSSVQVVCSPKCAIEYAREQEENRKAKLEQAARRRLARKKKELLFNDRRHQLKEAQREFNRSIRLRDAAEPCISCGRHHTGQYHAGHYRSVGACPELRFEPDNCHKQCAPCNNHKSGNITEYRIRLIQKLGIERVEWLESKHPAKKYSIEEIRAIREEYRQKANALERQLKGAA